MLLDHCKGLKIVLSFAVFHGVLSKLHHLVDVAEDHVLGGGVDKAAGVNVQQLGKGEPGTSTSCVEVSFSTMPKAKTSFVWHYFSDITKTPPLISGERVRQCKLCPYVNKSKSKTTTSMLSHLRSFHSISDVVNEPTGSDAEIIEDDTDSAAPVAGTSSSTVSTDFEFLFEFNILIIFAWSSISMTVFR
jgi:hypothetical protein